MLEKSFIKRASSRRVLLGQRLKRVDACKIRRLRRFGKVCNKRRRRRRFGRRARFRAASVAAAPRRRVGGRSFARRGWREARGKLQGLAKSGGVTKCHKERPRLVCAQASRADAAEIGADLRRRSSRCCRASSGCCRRRFRRNFRSPLRRLPRRVFFKAARGSRVLRLLESRRRFRWRRGRRISVRRVRLRDVYGPARPDQPLLTAARGRPSAALRARDVRKPRLFGG
jgi:hypothetical protein